MWSRILAINSFVFIPGVFICCVYTLSRALFYFEWKLFLICVLVFVLALIVQVVLSTLVD